MGRAQFNTHQDPPSSGAKRASIMTTQFEIGKTYTYRFIGDSNLAGTVTVASRTAQTIVTPQGKRFRVSNFRGVEQVKPLGTYSMCPVCSADRVA